MELPFWWTTYKKITLLNFFLLKKLCELLDVITNRKIHQLEKSSFSLKQTLKSKIRITLKHLWWTSSRHEETLCIQIYFDVMLSMT